jgi:hypothetical protein
MKRLAKHRPAPAMLVALVALFVASSGGAYAALNLPANSVGTKQLKNGAVTGVKVKDRSLLASDFKHGQLPKGAKGNPGPTGPPGANGNPGVSITSAPLQSGDAQCPSGGSKFTSASATTFACNGATGNTGPPGEAAVTGTLAGPVTTTSSGEVDLGFPALNVKLGSSGLVAIWATATMHSSISGGSPEVGMAGPLGTQLLASSNGTTKTTLYTVPDSHVGTTDALSGMIIIGPVVGGSAEFTLEFAEAGGGTATFSNVQLTVISL